MAEISGDAVVVDPQEFVRSFVLTRRPVIIRGGVHADPELRPLAQVLSRRALMRDHGDTVVPVTGTYRANTHIQFEIIGLNED